MALSQWNLDDQMRATIGNENRWLELNLNQPTDGLQLRTSKSSEVPNITLFQIQIATVRSSTIDCYLRGNDIIATIEDQEKSVAEEYSSRRQIYWRCEDSSADALAVQVILSSQTSLLQSVPLLQSQSDIQASELLKLSDVENHSFTSLIKQQSGDDFQQLTAAPACFLVRNSQSELSYAEMIHPADFQSVEYSFFNDQCCLRYPIFGSQLEKGVILRSRVQGVFLPRDADEELAANFYKKFVASKIPLTA